MRARELLMALIVAVVMVTACKPDKTPPPPDDRETPFVKFTKDGQLYGIVTGLNGNRFLIKAESVYECDAGTNKCVHQVAGCPTCSICDCTQPKCIKWCRTPPVIVEGVQAPGGDPGPAPQPTPTAPK